MKELKGRKLILILGMPLGLGCIYVGNPAFAIVTTLIMILGIDEFFKMCELKGSSPNRIFGFIITLFVALAYAGIYSHHQITVLGFCCAAVISIFFSFYKKSLKEQNIYFSIILGLVGGLMFFPTPDFSKSFLVGILLPISFFPDFISKSLLFCSFLKVDDNICPQLQIQ